MEWSSVPFWQPLSFSLLLGWLWFSSLLNLTKRFRSVTQPWVIKRVQSDTPIILKIQSKHNKILDVFFSVLSCAVSVPFYAAFLSLLFWIGHSKLGRQLTLLMAFCDYVGNMTKDLVSAPRPSCPPVRRVTATDEEKSYAMEYGLPSSHVLNTFCLSGYILYYYLTCGVERSNAAILIGFGLVFTFVMLVALARIYLGMHSLTDVIAGAGIGLIILYFWVKIDEYVDEFLVNGENVTSFSGAVSVLSFFAYPTPELPNPSYDCHVAFTGVAYGMVIGVQRTYHRFQHESPQFTLSVFMGRVLVGLPVIVLGKSCSKAIAKLLLPVMCNTLHIPITSSSYIPALKRFDSKSKGENDSYKKSGYFDVDTGIRFLQYIGLAWPAADLVPKLFASLGL